MVILEHEFGRIELQEGIMIANWNFDFVDLTVAKKSVAVRMAVMDDKKYPFLIRVRSLKGSTKEARDYLASAEGCQGFAAAAFCVDSAVKNVIVSLYLYLNKPVVPTKMFNDERKALEWLQAFKTK